MTTPLCGVLCCDHIPPDPNRIAERIAFDGGSTIRTCDQPAGHRGRPGILRDERLADDGAPVTPHSCTWCRRPKHRCARCAEVIGINGAFGKTICQTCERLEDGKPHFGDYIEVRNDGSDRALAMRGVMCRVDSFEPDTDFNWVNIRTCEGGNVTQWHRSKLWIAERRVSRAALAAMPKEAFQHWALIDDNERDFFRDGRTAIALCQRGNLASDAFADLKLERATRQLRPELRTPADASTEFQLRAKVEDGPTWADMIARRVDIRSHFQVTHAPACEGRWASATLFRRIGDLYGSVVRLGSVTFEDADLAQIIALVDSLVDRTTTLAVLETATRTGGKSIDAHQIAHEMREQNRELVRAAIKNLLNITKEK